MNGQTSCTGRICLLSRMAQSGARMEASDLEWLIGKCEDLDAAMPAAGGESKFVRMLKGMLAERRANA